MKKTIFILVALMATLSAAAENEIEQAESNTKQVEFTYEAGAELNSCYMWRGMYNGGLSFQPSFTVGYEGKHTSLGFNVWGNIGSTDWVFNSETAFVPEIDLSLDFQFYGVTLGATHLYYCDGSNFFNWKDIEMVDAEGGTSQTEVHLGYDFSYLLDVNLRVNWYTNVAGADVNTIETTTGEDSVYRAYSSYIEIAYTQELPWDLSLDFTLGMSPWASDYIYGNEKFAVVNICGKLTKEWEIGPCTLDLYLQGAINPDGITKENAYISTSGYDKFVQKLTGCVGLGVWF